MPAVFARSCEIKIDGVNGESPSEVSEKRNLMIKELRSLDIT